MTQQPAPRRAAPVPWLVPNPVKESGFVPLRPEHAAYNVEVYLGGIPTFGATTELPDPASMLWCDLQINPDTSTYGRLGSGRSGIYRGRYIKGVGRTSLAGNWANPDDIAHHSGYMRVSSAFRELLVSTYLEAKGCGDIINPCQGMLVKRMPEDARAQMADALKRVPSWDPAKPNEHTADSELHALTIKPAGFSRFSNLVWLSNRLHHYGEPRITMTPMSMFLRGFIAAVDPKADVNEATPATIAEKFLLSVDRGLDTLRRCWRLGISWGSLHNNFCADGRFLDLEWPVILGRPLVGMIGERSHENIEVPHRDVYWGLLEAYAFILHMRMLAWFFRGRFLSMSLMDYPVARRERDFCAEVAESFEDLSQDHLLFSEDKVKKMTMDWVKAEVDLPAPRLAELERTIDICYRAQFTEYEGQRTIPVIARPMTLPRTGLTTYPTPHTFVDVGDGPLVAEDADHVNRLIRELDSIGDADRLLARVAEAVESVKKHCAST